MSHRAWTESSPSPRSTRRAPRVRRGFSLVELTIVIGVIIILVGLVLAVSTIVIAKNEERSTRATLTLLDTAVKEWERQTDRSLTFQNSANPSDAGVYDVMFNPNLQDFSGSSGPEGQLPAPYNTDLAFQRTLYAIEVIAQQQQVRDILSKIPEEYFRRVRKPQGSNFIYYNLKEIVDGWGNPIRVVFPGRPWLSGDPGQADLDGTIRSISEDAANVNPPAFGVCRNRQLLFVSAGPDGKFTDDAATSSIDERADNIFSYGQEGQ